VRRLGLGAVPIGLLLVVAAVALTWWNEGRAVRTERALAEGARRVVAVAPAELGDVAPGTLVHVTAPASSVAGVVDPVLGVHVPGLRVRRTSEMAQWRRTTDAEDPDAAASYRLEWASNRIDSSAWPTERQNPSAWPVPSAELGADVRVAGVPVAPDLVARSDGLEPFVVDRELAAAAATHLGLAGVVAVDGALFLPFAGGRPEAPNVGDVRVRFERVPEGVVSLVGAYTGVRLEPAATRAGVPVALFRVGDRSAAELFAVAGQENRALTAVLRVVAVLLTFAGFRLALHPLAALARLVPLLGGWLGLGVTAVALVLGASTAATTIAIAWLAVRPLVAWPLLVAAGVGVVWLARRARARRPVAALATLVVVGWAVTWGTAAAQGSALATGEALRAAVAAGGTYELAAGTFELGGPWRIEGDLTLVGAGAEATTVVVDAAGTGAGIVVAPGAALRLEGLGLALAGPEGADLLRVDGGRLELVGAVLTGARFAATDDPGRPYGVGTGLVLRDDAEAQVEGGAFLDHALGAIEVGDDAVLEVDGTRFEANATGVFADGRAKVTIRGSDFSDHSGNALHVRGEAAATVAASTFVRDGQVEVDGAEGFDAVRVGGDARVAFEGVAWFDHPRFALSLYGRAHVTSRGGRFEGNGGVYEALGRYYSAVLVDEEATLELVADVLHGHAGGAIEAIGRATVSMEDVTVSDTGTYASVYVGDAADVRIVGGDVVGNAGALFAIGDGSLTLRGVSVRDGGGIGVQAVERARLLVESSEVRDHGDFGIALLDEAFAVVRDTVVSGNRSGIAAFGASRLRAERNVVTANERTGIAFLGASAGEARDNEIADQGWYGVVVGEDATAQVEGNVLERNVLRGVFFAERATGRVAGNTIRGSEVGLGVAPQATPEVGDNRFEGNGVDQATVD
jgi:hypothetical protein